MNRRLLMATRQRLHPPFDTEAEPVGLEVFQNAVVLELDDGERLVFDRHDLEQALGLVEKRAA
jgi:hypothetical protein